MIRLTFLLVLTSLLGLQSFAQIAHDRGVCGTHEIDIERTKANIAYAKANPLQSRMTTYIPIRFHLFGETDGSNAVSPNNLLDMIEAINVDFAPHDFQFFLAEDGGTVWDYTFNDDIFNEHASFQPFLRSAKASNAITVYIPNTATPPGSSGLGVTLGYYSPTNDYLVFKKSEVSSDASTASHEIGHYLSLPHPFRGWDCTSWTGTTNDNGFTTSPVTITSANFCSNNAIPIELVSRGSDGNCATAGDLFCDTPADYNLGFGWNGCNYTGGVQDATGTPLEPMENNFMGYFLDCTPYEFTPEQVAAMNADYASNSRSFLRTLTPTSTAEVTEAVGVVSPLDGETTFYSDRVIVDWEPVPNAQYYYVEVGERRSLQTNNLVLSEIVTSTNVTIEGLEGATRYYYRIRPFSQTSFGDYGTTYSFITGSVSGLTSRVEAVNSMTLFPNPTHVGGASTLKIDAEEGGEITIAIRDLTGRLLATKSERLIAGDNSIDMNALLPTIKGTYTVTVSNSKGLSSQKFSIL